MRRQVPTVWRFRYRPSPRPRLCARSTRSPRSSATIGSDTQPAGDSAISREPAGRDDEEPGPRREPRVLGQQCAARFISHGPALTQLARLASLSARHDGRMSPARCPASDRCPAPSSPGPQRASAAAAPSQRSVPRRPPRRPRARAAARPAIVRSRMRSRSNSARAPKTWKTSLPPLVPVSSCSCRLRKCTPRSCRSRTVSMRWRKGAAQPVQPPHDERVAGSGEAQAPQRGLDDPCGCLRQYR